MLARRFSHAPLPKIKRNAVSVRNYSGANDEQTFREPAFSRRMLYVDDYEVRALSSCLL